MHIVNAISRNLPGFNISALTKPGQNDPPKLSYSSSSLQTVKSERVVWYNRLYVAKGKLSCAYSLGNICLSFPITVLRFANVFSVALRYKIVTQISGE